MALQNVSHENDNHERPPKTTFRGFTADRGSDKSPTSHSRARYTLRSVINRTLARFRGNKIQTRISGSRITAILLDASRRSFGFSNRRYSVSSDWRLSLSFSLVRHEFRRLAISRVALNWRPAVMISFGIRTTDSRARDYQRWPLILFLSESDSWNNESRGCYH